MMIIKYVNKHVRGGYYSSVGGASTGPPPSLYSGGRIEAET